MEKTKEETKARIEIERTIITTDDLGNFVVIFMDRLNNEYHGKIISTSHGPLFEIKPLKDKQ